ncbi:MAG TPA: hypothetical protein VF878_00050 [Candidatus Udaeobacter sp.]
MAPTIVSDIGNCELEAWAKLPPGDFICGTCVSLKRNDSGAGPENPCGDNDPGSVRPAIKRLADADDILSERIPNDE